MLLELYETVADKCQVIYLEVPEDQLKTIQEQDQGNITFSYRL